MGGSITRRLKRGSQRHGARVKILLHGVVRLLRHLDELIEVLLHARLLGKRNLQLLGHTVRQEDGLWPSLVLTLKVVGRHLKYPHLVDGEQERPHVKTRMGVVERPSVTDQLVGIRQDLLRLSRLAMISVIGVPMHLRHDGVDVVFRHIIEDVDEPRRGALIAFFDTNQRHSAVVGRRVHQGVVAHDGDTVSRPKGRLAEECTPKWRRPRPFDARKLGRLVLCLVGLARRDAAAAHVAADIGRRPVPT